MVWRPSCWLHVCMMINSGRAELAAESVGAGPPDILFVHSGVGDRREWGAVINVLSTGARCLSYDARGHGQTRYQTEADWSPASDAIAVLDHYGVEQAIVIAASYGGRVAIDLALAHPDRVARLALIAPAVSGAPAPEFDPPVRELDQQMDDADAAHDSDRLNQLEAQVWLDGAMQPEGRVSGAPRDLFLAMNGAVLTADDPGEARLAPDAWDRLEELTMPTVVMVGEHDLRHFRSNARHLGSTIPNARFVELLGVAHLPHLEADATTIDELATFALGQGPTGAAV